MALRSPSTTTPRRDLDLDLDLDLGLHDSPLVDSLPPTSQGGSRKTKGEVDRLLAKLENEGVEIDDKIAGIIYDGIARIKAETTRENVDEAKSKQMMALLGIVSAFVGFVLGGESVERAFRKQFAKTRRA